MVEIVQRSAEAAPLFDLLRHKYALALSRDPNLVGYLDKIGELYFGRAAPKGFMESILGGMSSTPAPTSALASTSALPPAAAASVVSAPSPMATDVD